MNSSGKRYSCSSGKLQDENLQSNVDKNKAIIQKQNEQLVKLRDHFVKLRNLYHDERRDFAMKSLSYQRAIDSAKRKGDQLEQRINEIHSSIENAENEKTANEMIEKIWNILKSFRKEIFIEAGEDVPNDSFSVDLNRTKKSRKSMKATTNKGVSYGSSANDAKLRSSRQNRNTILESDSDSFDDDQPLSSPLNMNLNMNANDNFITPSQISVDITPITPITPLASSNPDEIIITPTTSSMNENFCDSIASRRTRRRCTTNVYYKEPSLRSALTPGDPFTFSLEDGIVTPTVPENYSRDTPTLNSKRGRRKNH